MLQIMINVHSFQQCPLSPPSYLQTQQMSGGAPILAGGRNLAHDHISLKDIILLKFSGDELSKDIWSVVKNFLICCKFRSSIYFLNFIQFHYTLMTSKNQNF